MVKKNSVIIFIFLLFTSTNVFAGDIPESIMEGKQKELFIGRITAINTDTYSIIPSTIMITRLMTYGYLNVHLRVFMSEADLI